MAIRFKCPHCQKSLAVKDHLGGKKAACPVCKQQLVIPAPVSAPADVEDLAAAAFAEDAAAAAAAKAEEQAQTFIDFNCPFCDEAQRFAVTEAGKQVPCTECRRIVKVPLPEKTGPKDWRELMKKGPSAALINQPEQLDGAWGTEVKTRVSGTALAEAEALPEVQVEPIGVSGWLRRGFYTLLVVGVLAGIWAWMRARQVNRTEKDAIVVMLHYIEPKSKMPGPPQSKLPPLQTAEGYRSVGELYIGRAERGKAIHEFQKARAIVADSKEISEVDRDLFLVALLQSIVELGAEEKAVIEDRAKRHFVWTEEIQIELTRTLQALKTVEGRLMALRSLSTLLIDKNQPELALTLANALGGGTDSRVQTQSAALLVARNKEPALKAPKLDGTPINKDARMGHAEGLARRKEFAGALEIVKYRGKKETAALDRLESSVAVALLLLDRPGGQESVKDAAPFFEEAMQAFLDNRKNAPPWLALQLVRAGYLLGEDEKIKDAEAKLTNPAFKNRLQLERIRAQLARANAPLALNLLDSVQVDTKADKEGNMLALAWSALARHNSRLGAAAEIRARAAELSNENLKPFLIVGAALGEQDQQKR